MNTTNNSISTPESDSEAYAEDPELVEQLCDVSDSGESLDQIFIRCPIFVEKTRLAKALNYCVRIGTLRRVDRVYFKPGTCSKPKNSKAPVEKPSIPYKKPGTKTKMGSLSKESAIRRVAFALFMFRDHMSLDDIKRISNTKTTASMLHKLCESKLAYRRGVANITYCWSKLYDYPFQAYRKSDLKLITELPESFDGCIGEKICRGI